LVKYSKAAVRTQGSRHTLQQQNHTHPTSRTLASDLTNTVLKTSHQKGKPPTEDPSVSLTKALRSERKSKPKHNDSNTLHTFDGRGGGGATSRAF
jgi:hypothetical protein